MDILQYTYYIQNIHTYTEHVYLIFAVTEITKCFHESGTATQVRCALVSYETFNFQYHL